MQRDYADRITWVAVADGERALLLRNDDIDEAPSLSVVAVEQIDNPPTREQGASPPGRNNDGKAGGVRKSSFEQTDFHQLSEDRFAKEFAGQLNKAATAGAFDRILIVAPPETLGKLRAEYGPDLKKRLIGELDRDLTRHTVEDIEAHVAAALKKH